MSPSLRDICCTRIQTWWTEVGFQRYQVQVVVVYFFLNMPEPFLFLHLTSWALAERGRVYITYREGLTDLLSAKLQLVVSVSHLRGRPLKTLLKQGT